MGADLERLTRRELEIGALVAEGLTYREIADKLFISNRTAEWHVEQIQNKLGLRSRSQIAARFAQAEVLRSLRTSGESAGKALWPAQPSLLVGRERETAEISQLLLRPDVRLVTVTGPPGVGKTSLGVRIAQELADEFSGGACFVDLSAIREPTLVPSAIAQVVGTRPKFQEMLSALRTKQMMIMLDNFEQVLTAAANIAELLVACGGIKILVTSRESLHLLRWEHEYPLKPLQLPDVDRLPAPAELSSVPSVALFLERARARNPEFDYGPSAGATIASICVRLDGIPLAIELAAAATKSMPPARILSRLIERSEILAQTGPDFPSRHRSLNEAIGTSYALLTQDERVIFGRLGVFNGGFDLEALEAVCTGAGITPDYAVQLLVGLVEKSLVQLQPGGARYALL
ncbi:MAG TPA: LuxR C-terminal-related transcriptional regulator, partial [Candidatus Dormibacteraeota bacterium]|nr:LuxR C-terminal-related transcriptional regulator [Candidatus Dormibacteraeota bacterium]